MSISKLTTCKQQLAIFVVVWVLSIPVAEGMFRLVGDRPSASLGGLFVPFGDGSYKMAPSIDTEDAWSAGRFTVHTDQLGLRCDEARRLAVKPGGHVDVLFLGDSQGYGNGVSFEESVAGGVAELAFQAGIHCANASVGGHSARNQLELARWLHDTEGIAVSNYVLLVTPLMVQYADSYSRASVGEDGRLYDDPHNIIRARVRIWIKTHCVVYDRVRDAIRNLGIGVRPSDDVPSVLRLYGAGDPESIVRDKYVALLKQLKSFAEQQRANVRLVYLPLTVEVDFAAMRDAAVKRGVAVDPSLPYRICSAAAAELNIPVTDLRPVVEQLHARGDPLRLKGDFHYDRDLSRACAASIWNDLKNELHNRGAAESDQQGVTKMSL
jgi:hypothetical protein